MTRGYVLLTLVLFLTACEKNDQNGEEKPSGNSDSVLAEATIGSSGGTLEADGIKISVPPGAFDSDIEVKIVSTEEEVSELEENLCTDVFQVEGIPENFRKPIGITLKHQGNLEEESSIAVGIRRYISEVEDSLIMYRFFDASDSSGYLIALLEPEIAPSGDLPASTLKGAPSNISSPLIMVGNSWNLRYKGDFFHINYPLEAESANMIKLVEFMDDAVDSLYQMFGADRVHIKDIFDLAGYPRVRVFNRMPHQNSFGYYTIIPKLAKQAPTPAGWLLARKIYYSVARDKLESGTDAELKSLAFMWVFRTFTYVYYGERLDWFSYGSCVWIKEKFSGMVDYTSAVYPTLGQSPFTGIQEGMKNYKQSYFETSILGGEIKNHEILHAQGMVPFFKYLDRTYANDKTLIRRIIDANVSAGAEYPVEGLISAINDPEFIWWPGFFKEFLSGKLYDLSADLFLNELKSIDQIDFYEEKDTTRYNDESYADLSAKLYSVNFLFPDFEREADLHLKVGPPSLNLNYVTAMAFGIKNNTMDYFDHAADLTITRLKELKQNGYGKIAVVIVNSANEPPFKESMNITLDTRLIPAPLDFNWVIVKVRSKTKVTYSDGTSSDGTFRYLGGELRTGELKNNKFTATWNEPYSTGTSYGTIVLVFDPDHIPTVITSYSVTETQALSDTRTYTISGEDLELVGYKESDDYITFYRTGTDACANISSQKEVYSGSGGYGYTTSETPICDDNSYLDIRIGVQ